MAFPINNLDSAKLQMIQEMEMEGMADMYNKMTTACHKKCIPPRYRESELGKGEAVCLDRCVAKYLDIYEKVGKKLMFGNEEEFAKKMQGEKPPPPPPAPPAQSEKQQQPPAQKEKPPQTPPKS